MGWGICQAGRGGAGFGAVIIAKAGSAVATEGVWAKPDPAPTWLAGTVPAGVWAEPDHGAVAPMSPLKGLWALGWFNGTGRFNHFGCKADVCSGPTNGAGLHSGLHNAFAVVASFPTTDEDMAVEAEAKALVAALQFLLL